MSLAGEPSRGAEGLQATVHSGCSLAATKLYLSELFFHLRRLNASLLLFHVCVCVCVCVCARVPAHACVTCCVFISLGPRGSLVSGRVDMGHLLHQPGLSSLGTHAAATTATTTGHLLCSQHSLPRPIFNWKLSQQWDTRASDGTASCHLNVN